MTLQETFFAAVERGDIAATADMAIAHPFLLAAQKPDSESKGNFTALHTAAFNGDNKMITLLVALGADIDARDYEKQTPLMKAREAATAALLALYKADVNAADDMGGTALMFSTIGADAATVQALLDNGADVHARAVATFNAGMGYYLQLSHCDTAEKAVLLVDAGFDAGSFTKGPLAEAMKTKPQRDATRAVAAIRNGAPHDIQVRKSPLQLRKAS